MATAEEQHERLSKKVALAVFSSDAISSTAYATEEILIALILAGTLALTYSIWAAALVAFLLVIVAISYRQTVYAYPSGGGSYIVAGENLGVLPGLDRRRVAAGRLRDDGGRERGLGRRRHHVGVPGLFGVAHPDLRRAGDPRGRGQPARA